MMLVGPSLLQVVFMSVEKEKSLNIKIRMIFPYIKKLFIVSGKGIIVLWKSKMESKSKV